jgi:dihydroneopterin aldolase
MLTVSLHCIRLHGPHGLYPEEVERGNDFEVDVDVRLPATINEDWPLVDYARINELVRAVMLGPRVPLLEMLVRDIWKSMRKEWPHLTHIKVAIRKLHPPMEGQVRAAQVCFEGS